MARLQIRRYIWLIDTIRSANGITYEEINRKWNRSALNEDGKDWPKRTFFQNINDIRDEFDIEITCDRRDNKYYIEEEFSEYGSIRSTLVDALVLNNEADPKGSVSCILYGDDELSEGSARVPLRFIHPSELRSFGSRSRGRGRPRSGRAFRQLHSGLQCRFFKNKYHTLGLFLL